MKHPFFDVLIQGTLIGGVLLLPFTGGYMSGQFAGILGFGVLVCALAYAAYRSAQGVKEAARALRTPLAALFIVMMVLKVTHDCYFYQVSAGVRASVQHAMWTIWLLGVGFVILAVPLKDNLIRLGIVSVALSVFMAFNIIGYETGMAPHVITYGVIKAIEGSALVERMVAPFGPGLNNYGCFASFAVQLNILLFWLGSRRRDRAMQGWALLGFVVSAYTLYLVQIRSGIIGIAFTTGFVLLPHGLKRWAAVIAFCGMLALPLAFFRLTAMNWLEDYLPQTLENSLARNDTEFLMLGGRAYIYDYGWKLLIQGDVGLLGKGMAERDSGPVMDEFTKNVEGGTYSFHNATMETLIVYGPVFGAALIVLLFLPLALRSPKADGYIRDNQAAAMGILGSLYVTSYLEAFSGMWFFWMIVLLGIGMLVQLNTQSMRSDSPSVLQ